MKCDELIAIESATAVIENVNLVYRKSDVDAAIAELKAKVDELSFDKKLLDNHWESEKIRCEAASRDCIELSNENAKLVSKIESLKVGHRQGIANLKSYYKAKLESVQASAYAESVDAGMENRRLKRALWLARANIANSTKYKYYRLSCKAEIDPQPHGWSCYINGEVYRTGKMNRKLEPHYWIELWEEVELKCRAKAEEYK